MLYGCGNIEELKVLYHKYDDILSKDNDTDETLLYLDSLINNPFIMTNNMPNGLCQIIMESFDAYIFWHSIHVTMKRISIYWKIIMQVIYLKLGPFIL